MILNKLNFKLMTFLAAIHLTAIVATPVLIYFTNNFLFGLLLLPSLVLTNTTWALIHEGIHSNFNSDTKKNNIYSRFLAILIHSNFEVLKFGHLMHHRYNRTDYDLTEGCNTKSKQQSLLNYKFYLLLQNLGYYFHITIGLYLAELIGPLLMLIPINIITKYADKILGSEHGYVINGKNILLKPARVKKIRLDNCINILFFSLIIFLYINTIWLYLTYLTIRALLISSVDNLPHYGCSRDKISGAFNLSAPRLWQAMILNFNLHRIHHKYPNLAWHLLPEKFNSDQDYYDLNYFRQYFLQWRGVIDKSKL